MIQNLVFFDLTKNKDLILALERRTGSYSENGEPLNGDPVSLALTNPQPPTPNLVCNAYLSRVYMIKQLLFIFIRQDFRQMWNDRNGHLFSFGVNFFFGGVIDLNENLSMIGRNKGF